MKDLGEKPIGAQSKLETSCSSNTSPMRVWTIQPVEVLARLTAARARGTQGVRLELELDPAEALLSDFDAWHAVLNRGYLGLSVAEDEAWYRRFEAAVPNRWAWPPPEPWYSDILTSWERIFDLETLAASEYRPRLKLYAWPMSVSVRLLWPGNCWIIKSLAQRGTRRAHPIAPPSLD
jgi:hypothetical protein